MLVVGPKEAQSRAVAVRSREKGNEGAVPLEEFAARIKRESDFEFSGRLAAILGLGFLNRLSDPDISYDAWTMGAIEHTVVSQQRICFLPSQRHDSRSSTP